MLKALSHQTQLEKLKRNESYLGRMLACLCAKQMHHVEAAVDCLCIFLALFKCVCLKQNFVKVHVKFNEKIQISRADSGFCYSLS